MNVEDDFIVLEKISHQHTCHHTDSHLLTQLQTCPPDDLVLANYRVALY